MNKKTLIGVLIGLIIVLVIGVGFFFVNENKTKENKPEINDKSPEEKPKKTKLDVIDLESKSRPVSVMINNHKIAQPNQTGLNDAYLVYEIVVEGGISRMMAVFKDSNLEKIGTIRSARPYFLDYVMENDAIYTHFGGSTEAEQDIKKLGIANVSGMRDAGFWRDEKLLNNGVPLEHTAYNKMSNIFDVANRWGYRKTSDKDTLLNYSLEELDLSKKEGATKADNVYIAYSDYQKNTFKYDEEKKVYFKYSGDTLRKDYVTNEPFYAKNIITYQVENYTSDSVGHQKLNNIGKGNGYFITNGYAVPITWEKNSRSSQTVYKYLNGEEIIVNDGVTHIQIQPKNRNLKIS